jgi:hypothetical protein
VGGERPSIPVLVEGESARADVGVLLVHGIGDHQEGQTLTAFGEPLVDWLQAWLRGGGARARGTVEVTDARLRASGGAPACARTQVSVQGPGDVAREEWLFCEAWWGDSVQPPSALRLLRWLFTRGPLLIYWHIYLGVASKGSGDPTPLQVWSSAFAFLLAGLCQLVVSVAMLLWLVPIGPWRRAVVSAVRTLTLTLGDSYVLLEHDIQRAALVERVRQSLGWLTERVGQAVVIAHSQGGAIAHEALRTADTSRVCGLITVGSGLEKLHFLRRVRDAREGLVAATLVFPLIAGGAALLLYGGLSARGERWQQALGAAALFGALLAAAAVLAALRRYRARLAGELADLELRSPAGRLPWTDIHATHDVVPMGAGSQLEGAPFVTCLATTNERSFLHDHVSYFQTSQGCLTQIWIALHRWSRLALLGEGDDLRLQRFARVDGWHARVLSASLVATWIAALVSAVTLRGALVSFGESVLRATGGSPLEELVKPVRSLAAGLAWVLQRLWDPSAVTTETLAQALFGALVLFGAIALWWVAFKALWRTLRAARWRRACRGRDLCHTRASMLGSLAVCLLLLGLGCMPLAMAVVLATAPEVLSVATVGRALAAGLAVIALLITLAYALAGPWVARVVEPDASPWERVTLPVFIWVFMVLFALFARWLWPYPLDRGLERAVGVGVWAVTAAGWQAYVVVELRSRLGTVGTPLVLAVPGLGTALIAWLVTDARGLDELVGSYGGLAVGALTGALAWIHRRDLLAPAADWWRQRRRS